jgi:hypothetical protein
MDQLVNIDNLPPLRQSTQEMMSCPKFYVTAVIEGKSLPGSLDSWRGTEIHRTMAAYLSYCALHGVSADLEAFSRFSRGAGPQAAKILAGLRDGFEVDYQHLFATELTLALDEKFEPTNLPAEMEGIVKENDAPAHYQGTLDGVYLFPEQAKVRIDDFKSHPRPFDPADKPQGKEYALFIFKHFPWAEVVTFRLVFVRYRKVTREVTFTRDQVPALVEALSAARDRQKSLHERYEAGQDIEAVAGAHCFYCPLLTNVQCPIAQFNPQAQYTPAERLNFNLWYAQFSSANSAAMRQFVTETGRPIVLRDYNGKAYTYGPEEKESEVYPVFQFNAEGMVLRRKAIPLLPIIDMLYDYAADNPDDSDWMKKVVISSTSLKRYLKTKQRAFLDQAIEDTCEKVTKVRLQVSKPLDAVPDEDADEEEWEESDDEL